MHACYTSPMYNFSIIIIKYILYNSLYCIIIYIYIYIYIYIPISYINYSHIHVHMGLGTIN